MYDTCLCSTEPSYETVSPLLCRPLENCSLSGSDCPFGFQQDGNGCLLCQCLGSEYTQQPGGSRHGMLRSLTPPVRSLPDDSCPDLGTYCSLRCPAGYEKDDFGCEVCECRPKCRPLTCTKTCPYGYV